MKRSVRLRLLVLAILPLVVLLPISLAVTMLRWSDKFDDLLIEKVASDLRIAEQYMRRIVVAQSVDVESLADSVRFERASQISPQALDDFLDISRAKMGLDYLVLRNVATGEVLAPEFYVFKSAIQLGKAEEIALFSPTDMAEISSEMANQAVIPLIETKAAIATERLVEDRGIVILSATHVVVQDEEFVLIGGTLLNQNLDFMIRSTTLFTSETTTKLCAQGPRRCFLRTCVSAQTYACLKMSALWEHGFRKRFTAQS